MLNRRHYKEYLTTATKALMLNSQNTGAESGILELVLGSEDDFDITRKLCSVTRITPVIPPENLDVITGVSPLMNAKRATHRMLDEKRITLIWTFGSR